MIVKWLRLSLSILGGVDLLLEIDFNLRNHRWINLLKDYERSILYHPNKANVVSDTLILIWKATSKGSLDFLSVSEIYFTLDIIFFSNLLIHLEIYNL